MNTARKLFFKTVFYFLLFSYGSVLYAQGVPPRPSDGGGTGTPPPPPGDPVPSAPIDDYIGVIVLLTLFYGFYTINNTLKTKTPK